MNEYSSKTIQQVSEMKKEIQVSASILCADFTHLGDEVKKCEDAGVDMLHIDVMDGHFVPNISIGQVIVEAIRPITKLPIEIHLMIENPGRYINEFITAGADIICVHAECYGERRDECREEGQFPKEIDIIDIDKAHKDIKIIQDQGKKAFIVINPGTPVCFGSLLSSLDGILIMSVNPGFAKQKFIPGVLSKVEELRKSYDGNISIDGGVNETTAPEAVAAGVNILATASYFFGSKDPAKTVEYLKSLKRA